MTVRRPLPLALLAGLAGLSALHATGLDPDLRAMVETVVATRERFVDPETAAQPEGIQAGIRAFLASFGDPATRYLSPVEWERLETAARGEFQGYGVLITRTRAGYLIERAYPDAPAFLAGIRDGDHLVEVAGRRQLPGSLDELRALLHADPAGVTVRVRRHGRELQVALRKGAVNLPSLEAAQLSGGVFYLRMRSFTERGPDELARLLPQARGSRAFVLDLRGNAGGVLDAAVEMHGLLAGPGAVTWIVDRTRRRVVRRTTNRALLASPPAVILVDRRTASAAEVLAASLARHGSLLIGEPTYGKGTIQEVVPLADGGAAVITVARYETAPGKPLPDSGLTPDQVLPLPDQAQIAFPPVVESDLALQHALASLVR